MILMHTTESTLPGKFSSYILTFQYVSLNYQPVYMQMFAIHKTTPMETIVESFFAGFFFFCYLF